MEQANARDDVFTDTSKHTPVIEKINIDLNDNISDPEGSPISKLQEEETNTIQGAESVNKSEDSNKMEEDEASNSSLLDVVVKHEKTCDDDLDSTIAICNIFKPDTEPQDSTHYSSTDETSGGEILITDLDSLPSDMKIESDKGSPLPLDLKCSSQSKTESAKDSNMRPMSPQIIILDLQSQDEYVSNFLSRGTARSDTSREDNDYFKATQTDQIEQTSRRSFPFIEESTKQIEEEEDMLFRDQNEDIFSPDYVRGKKFPTNLQGSPVFFHDLNCDYEHAKPKERLESSVPECDTIFYTPESYPQNKDDIGSSYMSPKVSLHPKAETDLNHQFYPDFSVNDSGFFDSSNMCNSSEKCTFFDGRTQDLSIKSSNQIYGMAKCNSNGQIVDSLNSLHGDDLLPNGYRVASHFINTHESHMATEGMTPMSPLPPYCYTNSSSPSCTNAVLFKQPVMDYSTSYTHGLTSHSDLTDSPCAVPVYPEWHSWNKGSNQALGPSAISPSPYINSRLPQPKYFWQGDGSGMENSDFFREYKKPTMNDDSEETEDADEFDDVPIFFHQSSKSNGYEQQFLTHASSNSCYAAGTPGSHYGSDSMTPPPSLSNTPSDTSSLYSPPPHLSANCCMTPGGDKSESTFLPYELSTTPKLPYPSMADMMRSTRAASTRSSGTTVKRILAETASQGGRFRKNQIQSDTISTSTSKNTRIKRKWAAQQQKKNGSGVATNLCINLDGLEEPERTPHGPRRHNEPLKQQAIDIMTQWYEDHLDNPYPTKADKIKMAAQGGVTVTQVKSWFANKRNRTNNTKPKVQKRAMEEKLKELFKDISCNRSIPLAENSRIIKQLSGIIKTCHTSKTD